MTPTPTQYASRWRSQPTQPQSRQPEQAPRGQAGGELNPGADLYAAIQPGRSTPARVRQLLRHHLESLLA